MHEGGLTGLIRGWGVGLRMGGNPAPHRSARGSGACDWPRQAKQVKLPTATTGLAKKKVQKAAEHKAVKEEAAPEDTREAAAQMLPKERTTRQQAARKLRKVGPANTAR